MKNRFFVGMCWTFCFRSINVLECVGDVGHSGSRDGLCLECVGHFGSLVGGGRRGVCFLIVIEIWDIFGAQGGPAFGMMLDILGLRNVCFLLSVSEILDILGAQKGSVFWNALEMLEFGVSGGSFFETYVSFGHFGSTKNACFLQCVGDVGHFVSQEGSFFF